MLFRYYKGFEKELRWKVTEVEQEQARLEDPEVAFATVLAVTESVGPGESVSDLAKYQGPFFVDVDSDDIKKSIRAARKVLKTLVTLGIPSDYINIWASGKKGFHFTVPMEVFTNPHPIAKLPLAYKQMAIQLKLFEIPEFDARVYSSGRGRMWRLPNKDRKDPSGKSMYKVWVSASELVSMSPVSYEILTSGPRDSQPLQAARRVTAAEALFNLSLGRAELMEKPKGIFIDPNLKAALGDETLPPCAVQLRAGENVKPGKGFNEVSLQFAKAVASFSPEGAYETIKEFAKNSKGESYATPEKRQQHTRTAFNIASQNSGYDWSCSSMLGVLKNEPCEGCPLAFIRYQQNEEQEEQEQQVTDSPKPKVQAEVKPERPKAKEKEKGPEPESSAAESVQAQAAASVKAGLMVTDDGYGFMEGARFRPISNFILKIKKVYMEYIPSQEEYVRVAVRADVLIDNLRVGSVMLENSNWDSKSSFISAFRTVAHTGFYGTDNDVQKMRSILLMDIENTAQQIKRVYSAGIHRQRIGKDWVFTYVEPGWSIDQFGMEDLYQISGDLPCAPQLKYVDELEQGDRPTEEVLKALMRVNQPERVAQMLGWTMASFLVPHIFTFKPEFPLLSLHGEPGSGKTSTAAIFAALHGINYLGEASPVNLPAATNFVVWNFIASTESIPRLLEEYNLSKMPRTFTAFGEYFKQCWNHHAVSRGTLKNDKLHGSSQIGATTINIPLRGPVVLCSEQELTMPALVERTLQIRLAKRDKDNPQMREAYIYCSERLDNLYSLARAINLYVISLDVKTVKGWLADTAQYVSRKFSDRPRHAYQCVLLGLRLLEEMCLQYKLKILPELAAVRGEFISWLDRNQDYLMVSKMVSEVDHVVRTWSAMAALSTSERKVFEKGHSYICKGDLIYIDSIVALEQYRSYVKFHLSQTPVIDNRREFDNLIAGEDYYVSGRELVPGMFRGKAVLCLNLKKMAAKGIDISGFNGVEEDFS